MTEQLQLAFSSLDFPGRAAVTLGEIAEKLHCSVDHLLAEIEAGALKGVDIRGAAASRRTIRVPIECYRAYVLERMTGPFRADFIKDLPRHVLVQLQREIKEALR